MNAGDMITGGLLAFTLATSFVTVAVDGVEYFTPPPVEGEGVADGPVRAGETTTVEWTITKRTRCDGVNARVWDGEGGYHLTESLRPTGISPAHNVTIRIPTEIPSTAPAGSLKMRVVGTYCPDTSPTHFVLGPVEFEVIE